MANVKKWITVNGSHIPIKEGQTIENAINDLQSKSIDELKTMARAEESDAFNYYSDVLNGKVRKRESYGQDVYSSDILKDERIMSREDWKLFYSKINELNNLDGQFRQVANGDYIFEVGDKMIYTDGKFSKPKINTIVQFNGLHETEIDYLRSVFYGTKGGKPSIDNAVQIIEKYFGKGTVNVYAIKNR